MVKTIELLHCPFILWKSELGGKSLDSVFDITNTYLLGSLNHLVKKLVPELLFLKSTQDIRIVIKDTIHEPFWALFVYFLNHPLLLMLKTLFLNLSLLLLTHLHLLNLRPFLSADPLELDSLALVLHLRNCKPQVKVVFVLLQDVIKGKLHDDLSEAWVSLAPLDSLRIPNYIVDLSSLAFLVKVLADYPETERYADASVRPKALPFSLRNRFLLEHVDQVVRDHVQKNLLPRRVLGLDHEARLRLNDSPSFRVNDGISMLVYVFFTI